MTQPNKYFKDLKIKSNILRTQLSGGHTVIIERHKEGTNVDIYRTSEVGNKSAVPIISTWAHKND